jgi:hypothetical protein
LVHRKSLNAVKKILASGFGESANEMESMESRRLSYGSSVLQPPSAIVKASYVPPPGSLSDLHLLQADGLQTLSGRFGLTTHGMRAMTREAKRVIATGAKNRHPPKVWRYRSISSACKTHTVPAFSKGAEKSEKASQPPKRKSRKRGQLMVSAGAGPENRMSARFGDGESFGGRNSNL